MYSWNENYIMLNQKPLLPIMGEMHFSRYPKEEWRLEVEKMKAGGIQILSTYVFWIHHEEIKGEWDFTGNRDLGAFLKVCKEVDMKVWLRIGPWAHGECRNGGFPDWLVQMEKDGLVVTRINDERYLALVDTFFGQIGAQAAGMFLKDGGPIIGVQIENEYGHCGGPSDRNLGMAHMNTLKDIAIKNGIETEMYTATGWGGGYVPEGMLAVLGGYVDAPWANHTHELPASENFLFQPFHDDVNIGSDFDPAEKGFTFDPRKVPYLTAELGGGLQVTEHRRTYPYPEDIEAQTLCMLGAGANLIGYYMFHGGVNPDGKLTTLQECTATGYANNLPEKSYDFQAPLRENGMPSESFFKLKKFHTFIKATEKILAPSVCIKMASSNDSDPENLEDVRAIFRYNKAEDCGFLFINNHQRKRKMQDKCITNDNPIVINLQDRDELLVFDNLKLKADGCYIIPYGLKLGNARIMKTNASFLCYVGDTAYFYTDEEPYYVWEGVAPKVVTLSTFEAEHAYVYEDKLTVYDGILLSDGTGIKTLKDGDEVKKVSQSFTKLSNGVYEVGIEYSFEADEYLLNIDFGGDKGRMYDEEGRLLTDWFSNGEIWSVALKRYNLPAKVKIILEEYRENVYYDLETKRQEEIFGVTLSGVVYEQKS